jgi:hypothetical protein
MICGECHRLLGRFDDAQRCYGEARRIEKELDDEAAATGAKVDVLREPERKVLALYEELAEKGEKHLLRQPYSGMQEPPIGWYIDLLLPAINAELDVQRDKWAGLSEPQAICDQINAAISAKRSL